MNERAAGILMPISSLPSEYGIGCFSKSAYEFVDWLKDAGQSYWHDAVFHVQAQLARALLRRAPAHAVRQSRNILDLFGAHPFALFGDRGGGMVGSLFHAAHMLHFV